MQGKLMKLYNTLTVGWMNAKLLVGKFVVVILTHFTWQFADNVVLINCNY